jgi:hypothetical protein
MNPTILQGADGAGGVRPDDEKARGGNNSQEPTEDPRPDSKWRQPVRQEQLQGQNFADDPVNPFQSVPSQYESIPVRPSNAHERYTEFSSVIQEHLCTELKILG